MADQPRSSPQARPAMSPALSARPKTVEVHLGRAYRKLDTAHAPSSGPALPAAGSRRRRRCGDLRDATSGRKPGLPGSSIGMATPIRRLDMKRKTILAALATALAASFAATVAPAGAA